MRSMTGWLEEREARIDHRISNPTVGGSGPPGRAILSDAIRIAYRVRGIFDRRATT